MFLFYTTSFSLFNSLFLCELWASNPLHCLSFLWHLSGLLLFPHNELKMLISSPCLLLVVKCILVASPGFVKDQFITHLYKEAVRQDNKILLENRPKFMLVHSSSGHKYSLKGTTWWPLRIKQSNLITRSKLSKMLVVLQKSSLIPLWQVGFLIPRWLYTVIFQLVLFLKTNALKL